MVIHTDFATAQQIDGRGQQTQANDDVQTVQTGDDVVQAEKNSLTRRAADQFFGIGINAMLEFMAPFKILIDKKKPA